MGVQHKRACVSHGHRSAYIVEISGWKLSRTHMQQLSLVQTLDDVAASYCMSCQVIMSWNYAILMNLHTDEAVLTMAC